jgi:hypothetical protein
MFILKDFPVSHGGYWRIHSAAAFVRDIFVGEEEFWFRPTNNALEALHALGYQCLHAAAEAEDGRSAFVKLLAMTLATS